MILRLSNNVKWTYLLSMYLILQEASWKSIEATIPTCLVQLLELSLSNIRTEGPTLNVEKHFFYIYIKTRCIIVVINYYLICLKFSEQCKKNCNYLLGVTPLPHIVSSTYQNTIKQKMRFLVYCLATTENPILLLKKIMRCFSLFLTPAGPYLK